MSLKIDEAFEVLEACGSTSSRTDKINLLKPKKANATLKKMFLLCYGHHRFYAYPTEDMKSKHSKGTKIGRWKSFKSLCNSLADRQVTGNAAKEAIEGFLKTCPKTEWKWYYRILMRDMGIGIQASTIHLIWPGLLDHQSVFNGVMKAKNWNPEDYEEPFKLYAERKMDGLRVLTVIDAKGEITMYTSGGKTIEHLHHIKAALKQIKLRKVVLDGEMVVWEDKERTLTSWRNTLSLAKPRKKITPEQAQDIIDLVEYHLFDCLTIPEYVAGECVRPMRARRKDLKGALKGIKPPLVVSPMKIVRSLAEIDAFYQKCLELGFEGIMIKDPKGRYKPKGYRGYEWLKIKPEEDVSGVIVGFKVGTKRHGRVKGARLERVRKVLAKAGKVRETKKSLSVKVTDIRDLNRIWDLLKPDERQRLNWEPPSKAAKAKAFEATTVLRFRIAARLGAFTVENEEGETVEVGGKMSDVQRAEFWDTRSKLKGKWIDYLQQKDAGDVGAARYPRFLRFRVEGDR